MDLSVHVEGLRHQLAQLAAVGGEESQALAERLVGGVESAARLMLLEALGAAADEITAELAPGSVEVRLRGGEPVFVVTPAPVEEPYQAVSPDESRISGPSTDVDESGATSRINLRLPEALKTLVEQAATRERLSINAWLVRAVDMAVQRPMPPPDQPRLGGQRVTGWVR